MTLPASQDLLTERVRGVLDVPLHRFLGLELIDRDHPERGVTVQVDAPAVNNVDLLHGGVVTALLDVASYLALLPHLAADEAAVTHDASASLMKGAGRGARLEVSGRVVRRGRTLAFVRAEATVDGDVIAAGQVTKSILRSAGVSGV
jgi:uncharacterized protein (TIGR00369 family)